MADYRSQVDAQNASSLGFGNVIEQANSLADFMQKKKQAEQEQQLKRDMPGIEAKAKAQEGIESLEQLLKIQKQLPPGAGVSAGGAALTRQPTMGTYDLRKQQMDEHKREFDDNKAKEYSKGLEHYSDFSGSAQDLENITNRDGKGGVFSNPDAHLISGGKVISRIPDSALGVAELMGAAEKGSAEERKAIARYKLAMNHALAGSRVTEGMTKLIANSLGGITSGDPDLMAKGLRGSARTMSANIKTVQSGFSPEVRGIVHDRLGADPMDFFNGIPSEKGPASNYKSPPAGNAQQIQQQTRPQQSRPQQMAPQPSPSPAPSPGGFDPDSYLKGGGSR